MSSSVFLPDEPETGATPAAVHPPLPTGATTTVDAEPRNRIDRFFEITQRGSTFGREIRGGIVTFVTMAYIVILNPLILGGVDDVTGDALQAAQIGAATGLTAGVMTILCGLIARLPFAPPSRQPEPETPH